jgi:serine/threonine-protein kinase
MRLPKNGDQLGGAETGAQKSTLTGRLLSGRWRVGPLLGRGGMSAVYEATHRNGKRVAVKVLRVDLQGNQRTRRRFMREGYIANQVAHDGVVAVLDDEVTDRGAAFIVMELLEGMNVEQYCSACGGTLPQGEVLAIADAVLDILVAAHAKRIIHRDIKPSNLFLTNSGRLKLLDFGIARFRETSGFLNITGEGALLGTPGFMAPEQARGRWNDIDARTDLWAVGALMFRLLTGRLVYDPENSNEYVIAAATESAPSLASVDPSLPRGIVELTDRALKSDAADRFQSALEMQTAVQAEMARFSDGRIPRPPLLGSAATLDESVSSNIAKDFSYRAATGKAIGPFGRAAKIVGPILPYGMGGATAAFFLAIAVAQKPSPANEPTNRTVNSPHSESQPAASMTTRSDLPATPTEPRPPPYPPSSRAINTTATPISRDPAAPGASARVGGRRAAHEAPPAPSTFPLLTSPTRTPPPRAARLEDVLDERR